jgi:Ca2+-binding RTX toxin-like protein
MDGANGVDLIWGQNGNDCIHGGAGVDFLWGQSGNDCVDGGASTDFIYGGNGSDRLLGGDGADLIWGGDGFDLIDGGAGFDPILDGGPGFDVIWLGSGGGNGSSGYIINGNSNLTCDCNAGPVQPVGNVGSLSMLPAVHISDCKPVAASVTLASNAAELALPISKEKSQLSTDLVFAH